METNSNTPEAKQPASAGCHPTPCSGSSCPCKECENYRKYLAWLDKNRSNGGMLELIEENRHLKDMLATLSKTHAKDMKRLSDMIDKRNEALGYIAEIMRGMDESGRDLLIGSTAYKSVIRWSNYFQNSELCRPDSE